MKKTIIALSALLVVQVALAVGLNLRSGSLSGQAAMTPLLAFKAGDVKRLTIADGDGNSVTLAEKDGGWVLPDAKDFPADGKKVKAMLADLVKAEESAPVATSSSAPKRFKVADDAFERKIVLGPKDKPLATVYLGSSQGAKQVHVRRSDQQGVRRMDFGIYQAPAESDQWVQRDAMEVDTSKIQALAWGDVKIEREAKPANAANKTADTTAGKTADKGADKAAPADAKDAKTPTPPSWALAAPAAIAGPVDLKPVKAVTDELTRLRVAGLAPDKAQETLDKAPPILDLTITLDSGKTRDYRIVKTTDGLYVAAASNLPYPVKLSTTAAEALVKATQDKAFAPPAPETPKPEAPAPEAPADQSVHGAAPTPPAATSGG